MADIDIRDATPADAEAICRVHVDSIRTLDAPFYTPEQIAAWTVNKKPESYVRGMVEQLEKMIVAVRAGQVVGFGAFADGEIRAVYVSPKHVGLGAGTGLCRTLERWALDRGFKVVQLSSSLQAASFYEKVGFRRVSNRGYTLSDGTVLEAVQMEKNLDGGSP